MGVSLYVSAYANKSNPEFKKHYEAVLFCIERNLSYPKETIEFFKGVIDCYTIEDYNDEEVLQFIENGIGIPLKVETSEDGWTKKIKVSDIPKEADEIIIEIK